MLDFKDIELSDKVWVDNLLSVSDLRSTEYCFSSIFIWAEAYDVKIARYKDFLVSRSGNGENASYSFSIGKGEKAAVGELVDLLIRECGAGQLRLNSLLDEHVELLSSLYGERFVYEEVRDSADYLYETGKLVSLAGKKLQPKRNLVSRFQREYPDWSYEAVTEENIGECMEMAQRWCAAYGCGQDVSLRSESQANQNAMKNFKALHLEGGLLRAGGRIIAYTLGERLNSDTYIVHIEKAFPEYTGAYQMINREFISRTAGDAVYVNREDDAGDEGLRKAKLSYYPALLLKKYIATIK